MEESDDSERRGYKVLVVDDDEKLLALARLALSRNGVEVETATTSADALGMMGGSKPTPRSSGRSRPRCTP